MNKVILLGRLVADPELRYTPSNVAVTSVRLAVDRPYSKGSERQADFIDVTCWRQTAEFVCRYFHKGDPIVVEGRLQVGNYTDRDGNKQTRYNVQAENVDFVPGNRRQDNQPQPQGEYEQRPAPQPPQQYAPQQMEIGQAYSNARQTMGNADVYYDDADDLPF